jgi:hypothetical protein
MLPNSRHPSAGPSTIEAPEIWQVVSRDAPVASLTIPGLLSRRRTFDIDVQLRVRVPADARSAQLGLSLEIDGSQQWSRRIPASLPGELETLDYHCRLVLEPEQQMRLRARAQIRGVTMDALTLSAVEERPL